MRLRTRLDGRIGNDVRVVRTDGGQQPLYRVRVGPLQDVDEADRVSKELTAMGYETHIAVETLISMGEARQ